MTIPPHYIPFLLILSILAVGGVILALLSPGEDEILLYLYRAKRPQTGLQIGCGINALAEFSAPALLNLEDQGLISSYRSDGRTYFYLTAKGFDLAEKLAKH